MKQAGIFDRVRFLESRLDRLEVIILEQDGIIRAQAKALGLVAPATFVEPAARDMANIVATIASDNGLTLSEIKSDTMAWAVSHPRQYAYAVLMDHGYSAASIGRFFGRDHTTVLTGAGKARARIRRMEERLGQ